MNVKRWLLGLADNCAHKQSLSKFCALQSDHGSLWKHEILSRENMHYTSIMIIILLILNLELLLMDMWHKVIGKFQQIPFSFHINMDT